MEYRRQNCLAAYHGGVKWLDESRNGQNPPPHPLSPPIENWVALFFFLRDAIAGLPPGQREAVEQLGLKELTLAEAANLTGRNTGALKVNLHRALKALRGRLHGEP